MIRPNVRYPGQHDNSDPTGYPHGKPRNDLTLNDGTGTPLEEGWVGDIEGLKQTLVEVAGITPSDEPDKVGACQTWDALQDLFGMGPPLIVQADGTLEPGDPDWPVWARSAFMIAIGGGCGGGGGESSDGGGGGGGSGYVSPLVPVDLNGATEMTFDIGAGGAGGAGGSAGSPGADTTVLIAYGPQDKRQLFALGAPAPTTGQTEGGNGYSGGGAGAAAPSQGGSGGRAGRPGTSVGSNNGGTGISSVTGGGFGWYSGDGGSSVGGPGDTQGGGGGGGGQGFWPGSSARGADGSPGTGTDPGQGGAGGAGFGAGGGGGGELGTGGENGAGGAGYHGAVLIWWVR